MLISLNMASNRYHAQFTKKNLKRSQKSVKGKESRLMENLRLFRHKVYQIIGILLIYHFFFSFTKKAIWNLNTLSRCGFTFTCVHTGMWKFTGIIVHRNTNSKRQRTQLKIRFAFCRLQKCNLWRRSSKIVYVQFLLKKPFFVLL